MPTEYATKVEQLDRKHPGLRQLVDFMLDGHGGLGEIQEAVKEKFSEEIALSTLSSYKLKRWKPRRDWIDAIKNRMQAVTELLGNGNELADIQQAQLFEQVQSAMDDGARLDPHFLLKEQRQWAALQLKREQLEQAQKELELKLQQIELQRTKEREEIEKALGGKDAQTAFEDIKGIYGLA